MNDGLPFMDGLIPFAACLHVSSKNLSTDRYTSADSVEEGKAIAELHPDVMVCELTSLIGTGQVAGEDYMRGSTEAVKAVSPETQVLQAAGIHSGANVYDAIKYGADGTGGTSGIVAAEDPFATLDEMFEALDRARTDFCKED